MVLGGPGSGKTSLLLHITREVALGEDVSERATLPILVRARDLGPALEAGTNLRDHLLQRHAPEYAELLRRVLDTGPFLLLIDSIDEAGTEETRRAISNMVADFARQHEQGRVIASSRPAGYESWGLPAAFSRHYLLPFDGPHIRDYVSAWLGSQRAPADVSNIDGVLAEMRAASVLPLAQTPLLLALLMLVRGADGRLTGRRTVLYNHAVDALAERWPRRRGADISPEDLLAALRPLAVAAASRSGPIPEQDLIAALVAVRVERGASRSDARRWAQRLLRTVEDETGVVAQVDMVDGEGRWVFFHRSIADHLAARDLADRWLDGESPFERLLGDAAGREILGFALGHLDDDGPEIGARALLEILNGRDQLEAFTGRRARFVVELLTDTGIRATPGVRAAALARVRAIAVDPRSPWRVQAASLLARYQAGSGEDPWSDLWVPEGAGAVAHAVASWACGPLEPDRVAAVQESMAAGFVDEDIERTASVVAEVLTSLGGVSHSVSLQVVILGRAYARVDRAIGEALRAGGVPSLDGKHLLTAVASRSVPPIWMCDLGLDLDLADLLLVLEAGLPADFAAEITSWWDRSEWIEPTEEQLDLLAQLAVQHPEGFLLLYEEMDRRDDDDDGFDASPWDPALVALASASEGALARRALATFVGAVGVDVILGSHLELRDSVIHAAADACHPSEWEVERDRLVATYRDLNLDTRAPIDGVRVAALRALIDHDDPAIRGSAARALLGICDSRREEALVAFVRDRACGPSLLEDLSAHARGDPWVVRSLFLRLLALCEAVDVAEWQGVAQQVLLHAIDAAAELAGDDLDRSFEMESPSPGSSRNPVSRSSATCSRASAVNRRTGQPCAPTCWPSCRGAKPSRQSSRACLTQVAIARGPPSGRCGLWTSSTRGRSLTRSSKPSGCSMEPRSSASGRRSASRRTGTRATRQPNCLVWRSGIDPGIRPCSPSPVASSGATSRRPLVALPGRQARRAACAVEGRPPPGEQGDLCPSRCTQRHALSVRSCDRSVPLLRLQGPLPWGHGLRRELSRPYTSLTVAGRSVVIVPGSVARTAPQKALR